ncbi:MAG TPA: outer membrane lipoprotein-sorting protein [Acidobacteriaceae bacterium]|nr:outer membrane lipoprotein-sorting protein [Acidobacteriaceae bacterium]
MSNRSRNARFLTAAFLTALCAHLPSANAQAKPSNLSTILAQMNSASQKFTSAQADLRQELYTKLIHDTETQTGKIYFIRKNSTTQMGMTMLPTDATPSAQPAKIVQFQNGQLQVLTTGTGQIDKFTATGKNQATAETIMTLGFGGSGTDLEKSWTVTDQGPDQITESGKPVKVEKLDLVPKAEAIRNTYSHVTIWVDPIRDVSLKQVSYDASSGDTRTILYTNIRLNQPVDTAPFALKCKSKCTVVNH